MPDKRLRRLFRGRLRVGHLHHRMGHFKRFDPEFALQQFAKIPVEHGAIDGDIHQLILPTRPFQSPAIAKLARHQLPLEGGQRRPGLLPQPLVALMGESQQADADEQQENQPHQPEKDAFYPDHNSGPNAKCSRKGLSSSDTPTARSSLT